MDGATLSNRPSIPSPEVLRELLADENNDLVKRADELAAALTRAPETIADDETSGRVADFVRQIDAAIKLTETRRTSAKQPALDAGKAIDGFFRPLSDKLEQAKTKLKRRIETYLIAKAAEERRAREEEARRAEEERKRKEAEALAAAESAPPGQAEEKFDDAIQAQATASAALEAATAKPADLARTRGEYGSVSTLQTRWTFEITDEAKIPLETLRPHLPKDAVEKAIRAFVKAGNRELLGVRIFQESSAVIR